MWSQFSEMSGNVVTVFNNVWLMWAVFNCQVAMITVLNDIM